MKRQKVNTETVGSPLPLIFSTSDQTTAMGAFSPEQPKAGYVKFYFKFAQVIHIFQACKNINEKKHFFFKKTKKKTLAHNKLCDRKLIAQQNGRSCNKIITSPREQLSHITHLFA